MPGHSIARTDRPLAIMSPRPDREVPLTGKCEIGLEIRLIPCEVQ